ncbi:MAG: hypothetical protein NTNFB01_37880 [Nitrospira sp.]
MLAGISTNARSTVAMVESEVANVTRTVDGAFRGRVTMTVPDCPSKIETPLNEPSDMGVTCIDLSTVTPLSDARMVAKPTLTLVTSIGADDVSPAGIVTLDLFRVATPGVRLLKVTSVGVEDVRFRVIVRVPLSPSSTVEVSVPENAKRGMTAIAALLARLRSVAVICVEPSLTPVTWIVFVCSPGLKVMVGPDGAVVAAPAFELLSVTVSVISAGLFKEMVTVVVWPSSIVRFGDIVLRTGSVTTLTRLDWTIFCEPDGV